MYLLRAANNRFIFQILLYFFQLDTTKQKQFPLPLKQRPDRVDPGRTPTFNSRLTTTQFGPETSLLFILIRYWNPNMARIIIIDDHPAIRDGLATRIVLEPDLEVVGEAADVTEGLAQMERTKPDLAVVDISLKTGNGIDVIKRAKERFPEVRILVWSMYDESLYAERALRAGAMGYINKEHASDTIVSAIRSVLKDEVFLSPNMSSKVLQRMINGKRNAHQSPVESLSDRELQTFQFIGLGLNTGDIARKMELSPKTIETYRARIKQKIDVKDMAELTREATRWVMENE